MKTTYNLNTGFCTYLLSKESCENGIHYVCWYENRYKYIYVYIYIYIHINICVCVHVYMVSWNLKVHRISQNWIYMLSISNTGNTAVSPQKVTVTTFFFFFFCYWAIAKQNKNSFYHPGNILNLYQKWEHSLI